MMTSPDLMITSSFAGFRLQILSLGHSEVTRDISARLKSKDSGAHFCSRYTAFFKNMILTKLF